MPYQYSASLRDARLRAVVRTVGSSPVLKLFGGQEPLTCEDADPPNLLATLTLPKTPFSDSTSGIVTKRGVWSGKASGVGYARCFRICNSAGITHLQGSVGVAGQPCDMVLDKLALVPGQTIEIASFAIIGAGSPGTPGRAAAVIDDDDIDEHIQGLAQRASNIVRDGQAVQVRKDGSLVIKERKLNRSN